MLLDSTPRFVCRLIGWSVGWSVGPLFIVLTFCSLWPHWSCPKCSSNSREWVKWVNPWVKRGSKAKSGKQSAAVRISGTSEQTKRVTKWRYYLWLETRSECLSPLYLPLLMSCLVELRDPCCHRGIASLSSFVFCSYLFWTFANDTIMKRRGL